MFRRIGLVALLVGACTAGSPSQTVAPATTASTSPLVTSTTAPAGLPSCLSGTQPYVENGGAGVIEREDSDSEVVAGIRWSRHNGCDRVVIEFATVGGAPAVSPPGVGPLFIRSAGVLRLQFDASVTASAVRDAVIDGSLVSHAYVVRRATGELFVDLLFASPAAVRVSAASLPARIVVDAVLEGSPYPSPPIVTDALVLIDPVGGLVLYPFTVNGYVLGQTPAMPVVVSTGQEEASFTGDVGQGADAWKAFTVLVPAGPKGAAQMLVGDRIPVVVDLG